MQVGRALFVSKDNDAITAMEHLDVGPIHFAENVRSQHLVGSANANLAARDVDHPVDVGQHGVDLVGDEEHPEVAGPARIVDESGDLLLVAQVEAGQRFVSQQQLRISNERLGDTQSLLLTTRHHRQRRISEGCGAD